MSASKFATGNHFQALGPGLSGLPLDDENESTDGSEVSEGSTVRGDEDAGADDHMASFDRLCARKGAVLKTLVTKEQFEEGRSRRYGTANPEVMDVPFWKAMVETTIDPYVARKAFKNEDDNTGEGRCGGEEGATHWSNPIWTNNRHAQTRTKLPDGSVVEIAGEHEDFYDPDFLIYNDVIVWDAERELDESGSPKRGNTKFTIYGYPKDVFPPTDNHSATYVPDQNAVFIIGNLGYGGDREERGHAYTSVFRLKVGTWAMERVETTGEGPGAIWRHEAELKGNEILVKSNGEVPGEFGDYCCTKRDIVKDGKEESVNVLTEAWALDLDSLIWREYKLAVSNGTV
ncbi:hypothetical protein K491DRAFT_694193 [Lophiostoma macrostomum CBS 122681]|uniref:Uncharacterized protein n=1 Tax=Lophiostoma macrostomum CBS 122681 TaxID=1314788 RepID=A0A6A6T3V9_9PLEO|nr:hypothetical protein K491DRAFT_694193 [Lophiostoma macrostomum CBS 122681]